MLVKNKLHNGQSLFLCCVVHQTNSTRGSYFCIAKKSALSFTSTNLQLVQDAAANRITSLQQLVCHPSKGFQIPQDATLKVCL